MTGLSSTYDALRHNVVGVSRFRLFIRALGVSFFSLLSLGLAFYAFAFLPQVQDLFFDIRSRDLQGTFYWFGFYFVGLFVWALPLVFTARLLMLQNFDLIGVDTEARFKFFVFRMPSYFAVFAFASVLTGIFSAAMNLPEPTINPNYSNEVEKPIAAALQVHLINLGIFTLLTLILIFIRNTIFLGLGRFVENIEKKHPKSYKNTLLRFERWTRKPDRDLNALQNIHLMELKPAWLSEKSWIEAQRSKVFMMRYLTWMMGILLLLIPIHFISHSSLVLGWASEVKLYNLPVIGGAIEFLSDTAWFRRAAFLFFVFGAWLPFITVASLFSNRYQFPIITTIILAALLSTIVISDGHDARVVRYESETEKAKLKPIAFDDAVASWKQASGWNDMKCDDIPRNDRRLDDCPRPIIVAGEGGGSRAAFLLASVLGELQERSIEGRRTNPNLRRFDQQLFAISSVSGSSVGAAFFVSSLKKHEQLRASELENFKEALYQQKLWFLNIGRRRQTEPKVPVKYLSDVTHKDALQAALSNDFLSPALVGFLARDLPILSRTPGWMDRAGVLETSWETAFDSIYGRQGSASILSEPLMSFAPTANAWTPLLFMNATSTETGRRVIATPVDLSRPIAGTDKVLLSNAYDLHELFCSIPAQDISVIDKISQFFAKFFSPVTNADCAGGKKPRNIDIRLSTAASVSARSPFVSPHGGIRDRTGQNVDSLVDGGYFDNSGAVTALEIAETLTRYGVSNRGAASDKGIMRPFIIQISSEPEWFSDFDICKDGGQDTRLSGTVPRPKIPDESDFRPFGTLGNIFTVNSTRIARGYETILQSPDAIRRINRGYYSHASITVCPQPKQGAYWWLKTGRDTAPRTRSIESVDQSRSRDETTQKQAEAGWKSVSLSWWLSPPLQAYIDAQVYQPRNLKTRGCVLWLLGDRRPETTSIAPDSCRNPSPQAQ